jgi:hypothetical protein
LLSPKSAEDDERLTFKHRQGKVKYLPQVLPEMIWGRNKPIMSNNSKAGKRKTASHKERGGKKELCLEGRTASEAEEKILSQFSRKSSE